MDDQEHKRECLARWHTLVDETLKKYRLMKARKLPRRELEAWLQQQRPEDEATLRGILNRVRG